MWCCFSSSCACLVTTKMSTDLVINDVNEQHLQDDVTDDSCKLELIEIVPTTRDADECDSGDWSAEVKQQILPILKLQPEVVCCIVCYMYNNNNNNNNNIVICKAHKVSSNAESEAPAVARWATLVGYAKRTESDIINFPSPPVGKCVVFVVVLQEENATLRAKIDSLQDKYYFLSICTTLTN